MIVWLSVSELYRAVVQFLVYPTSRVQINHKAVSHWARQEFPLPTSPPTRACMAHRLTDYVNCGCTIVIIPRHSLFKWTVAVRLGLPDCLVANTACAHQRYRNRINDMTGLWARNLILKMKPRRSYAYERWLKLPECRLPEKLRNFGLRASPYTSPP